jgi:signal transduction histidine kinase/putative methionine-R-sulfoxide reductase with GAF domain
MSSTARPLAAKRLRCHRASSPNSAHDRSNLFATVLQIAGQFAGILDLDPLLDQIARQTQMLLSYEVALLLVEGDTLTYCAIAGEHNAVLGADLPLNGDSLPAQALRLGAPVLAAQANVAAFPLIGDEQPAGVIELARAGAGGFRFAELEALTALARQAALAIQTARRHTAAQRCVRELALLEQIRSSVVGQPNLPDLLRDVVDKVAMILGYSLVSLYTLRGEQLLLKHQIGYASLPSRLDWNDGALGQAARTGTPVLRRVAALASTEHAKAVTSSLCVALRGGGVVYGILCIENTGPHLLDADDQRLLLALADQVDMAIEYNQLYEALEARVSQLALVDDLSRTVTASLDQHAALNAIGTQVPRAVPCQRLSLASYDSTRHTFTIRALWLAGDQSKLDVGITTEIGDTEAGVALRTGRTHYVCDLRESLYPVSQKLVEEGLRSIVHVPIMAPEGCLGMLSLSRATPRAFSAYDLALLGSLAPHIATAFKNAELYAQAQQAYAELAAAQERNVQAEKLRAIGELASGVAHDFNNLLAIILGHTELIKQPDSPHFARSHRAIVQAAKDGAHTVRRIQEFVRARPEHHTTQVDLAELADDVLELTKPRWRTTMLEKGITIDLRQNLQPVPPILGDAAELREVVTNLILNAVDAMPRGGTLTVETCVAGEQAWLDVGDTGMGIALDLRERIFEPFFTTKAQRGTGLGLAVSRSIARRHEGDLTVESTPGSGSRFRLMLPLPAIAAVAPAIEQAAPSAPLRPLRVLLVEDDREVRNTLAQLLMLDDHSVARAADGAEALALFRPGSYDVVCSDLGMPGMNGWELIAQLRERDPAIVTVLLSGWGAQIDSTEARARGADFVVAKPIDFGELHNVLVAASQRLR